MSMCPFATDPDATGCDCDCGLVDTPKGCLSKLAWFAKGNSTFCTSGAGGRGDGSLPCERYDKWRKEHMNNDTHGEKGEGWYGFDLDGTLAKYDGWKGIDHIGEPVKPMVELIRRMHDEGKTVKIMTARVAPRPFEAGKEYGEQFVVNGDGVRVYAHTFVEEWCARNLGFVPEIVYQKDHLMLELYDDRVKQVVPNEGWLVEDIAMSKRQRTETTIVKHEVIDVRWWGRINCFLLGMAAMAIIVIAIQMYAAATVTVPEAERKLRDAVSDYMQSKLDERVESILK